MSASPNNVPEDVEKQSVDELAEGHTADDAEPGQSPFFSLRDPSPFVFRRAIFVFRHPLACLIAIADRSPLSDLFIPPYLGSSSAQPAKRGRGRPKGSKNKKTLAAGAESSATPSVPRKRGRPPKVRVINLFIYLYFADSECSIPLLITGEEGRRRASSETAAWKAAQGQTRTS